MLTLKNGNVVPCGKCPACLANQRSEWIFRLKQEYLDSSFAIFVTLTYNDEHVPEGMNVCKKDVQLFHKRLRKHFKSGELRYYVVSEYGDHTYRPHYHGLYFFKSDFEKDFIYKCFEESWQQGFIKFGEVEEGSIVYCTKYCLKHSEIPEGRVKTFRLVSKMNGGIGIYYLKKMGKYHSQSLQFNSVSYNGQRSRFPRYYLNKLSLGDISPSDYLRFKEERKERIIALRYKEAADKFRDFCHEHKGLSYPEMCRLFNESQEKSQAARDDLILKHCKKQKL